MIPSVILLLQIRVGRGRKASAQKKRVRRDPVGDPLNGAGPPPLLDSSALPPGSGPFVSFTKAIWRHWAPGFRARCSRNFANPFSDPKVFPFTEPPCRKRILPKKFPSFSSQVRRIRNRLAGLDACNNTPALRDGAQSLPS